MSITLNLLIIAALVLLSGLFAAAGTAVAMARHGPLSGKASLARSRARRPACGGALRDGRHGHWRRAVDRAAERPPGGLADRPLGGEPCGRRLDGSGRRPDGGDPRPRRPCPRANRAQPCGGDRPLAAAGRSPPCSGRCGRRSGCWRPSRTCCSAAWAFACARNEPLCVEDVEHLIRAGGHEGVLDPAEQMLAAACFAAGRPHRPRHHAPADRNRRPGR